MPTPCFRLFSNLAFLLGQPLCLVQISNPTAACRHPSPPPPLIGYAMLGDPFPLVSQALVANRELRIAETRK